MRSKLAILTLCALVMSVSAATAQGQRGNQAGAWRGSPAVRGAAPCVCAVLGLPGPRIIQDLALTEEQNTKLKALLHSAPSTLDPLRQNVADAVDALRKALCHPEKDAAAVKDLADKAQKAEAAFSSAQLDLWLKFRAILTADQLKKLGEVMAQPRPWGPGPGAPGAPPPPGGMGAPPPPPLPGE